MRPAPRYEQLVAEGRIVPAAIHLAAALSLEDDLDRLATYDDRMLRAAAVNGLTVASPRRAG